jgi:hypothetical protein
MERKNYEDLLHQCVIDWQSLGDGREILSVKDIDYQLDAIFCIKGLAYYPDAQDDLQVYMRQYHIAFRKIIVGVYT